MLLHFLLWQHYVWLAVILSTTKKSQSSFIKMRQSLTSVSISLSSTANAGWLSVTTWSSASWLINQTFVRLQLLPSGRQPNIHFAKLFPCCFCWEAATHDCLAASVVWALHVLCSAGGPAAPVVFFNNALQAKVWHLQSECSDQTGLKTSYTGCVRVVSEKSKN